MSKKNKSTPQPEGSRSEEERRKQQSIQDKKTRAVKITGVHLRLTVRTISQINKLRQSSAARIPNNPPMCATYSCVAHGVSPCPMTVR